MTNEADKPEFDETAVLEELERLRGAIRLARSKREEKVAEFETFVRDARMAARRDALRATGVELDDDEVQTAQLHPRHVPELPEFAPVTVPPWSPPPSALFETPSAPDRISRLDDMSEATAAFPDPVPHHRTRDTYIIAGAAVVLILVLALLSWIGGDSPATPGRSTPASSYPGAPAATNPATTGQPSQAGESSATPSAPLPLQVELVALRKVWMRVTVDGDRAIEQEVEEGQRLRFGASKAIVVRAGDAGAVTISIDGQAAAPLGRAGQAATRTVVPRPK